MKTEFISMEEVGRWVDEIITQLSTRDLIQLLLLMGEEQRTRCQEAVGLRVDGSLVAVAILMFDDEKATVLGLFVHPSQRGRGLGVELMGQAIECCLDRGFPQVHAEIASSAGMAMVFALPAKYGEVLKWTEIMVDGWFLLDLLFEYLLPPE